MSYLGVDTSKDLTVNGMKYSKNKDGWYESEANSDAQDVYKRQVQSVFVPAGQRKRKT